MQTPHWATTQHFSHVHEQANSSNCKLQHLSVPESWNETLFETHVSLAGPGLLFPNVPVQAIVHTQEPVMGCIQLAHSGDGMLAHVDENSIPGSKALSVLAIKGAPHFGSAVCRNLHPDLDGLGEHQGARGQGVGVDGGEQHPWHLKEEEEKKFYKL